MPKTVIALVGQIASGKGTVAKILGDKGFYSYSLSDRIREEILSRGMEITRQNLTDIANEMREKLGSDILARKTATLVETDNHEKVVIDSIRNPAEIRLLRSAFNAKILGIIAPQEKRFEYYSNRQDNNLGVTTWEEFKNLDNMELMQTGEHKQQVQACLDLADTIIENSGTIEDLKKKVTLLV